MLYNREKYRIELLAGEVSDEFFREVYKPHSVRSRGSAVEALIGLVGLVGKQLAASLPAKLSQARLAAFVRALSVEERKAFAREFLDY